MVVILKDKINVDEKKLLLKEIKEYNKNKLKKINNEKNEHLKGGGGKIAKYMKNGTKTGYGKVKKYVAKKSRHIRRGIERRAGIVGDKFKEAPMAARRRLGKATAAVKSAPGAFGRGVRIGAVKVGRSVKRGRKTRKIRKKVEKNTKKGLKKISYYSKAKRLTPGKSKSFTKQKQKQLESQHKPLLEARNKAEEKKIEADKEVKDAEIKWKNASGNNIDVKKKEYDEAKKKAIETNIDFNAKQKAFSILKKKLKKTYVKINEFERKNVKNESMDKKTAIGNNLTYEQKIKIEKNVQKIENMIEQNKISTDAKPFLRAIKSNPSILQKGDKADKQFRDFILVKELQPKEIEYAESLRKNMQNLGNINNKFYISEKILHNSVLRTERTKTVGQLFNELEKGKIGKNLTEIRIDAEMKERHSAGKKEYRTEIAAKKFEKTIAKEWEQCDESQKFDLLDGHPEVKNLADDEKGYKKSRLLKRFKAYNYNFGEIKPNKDIIKDLEERRRNGEINDKFAESEISRLQMENKRELEKIRKYLNRKRKGSIEKEKKKRIIDIDTELTNIKTKRGQINTDYNTIAEKKEANSNLDKQQAKLKEERDTINSYKYTNNNAKERSRFGFRRTRKARLANAAELNKEAKTFLDTSKFSNNNKLKLMSEIQKNENKYLKKLKKKRGRLKKNAFDNTQTFKPISGLGSLGRGNKLRGSTTDEGSRAKKISNLNRKIEDIKNSQKQHNIDYNEAKKKILEKKIGDKREELKSYIIQQRNPELGDKHQDLPSKDKVRAELKQLEKEIMSIKNKGIRNEVIKKSSRDLDLNLTYKSNELEKKKKKEKKKELEKENILTAKDTITELKKKKKMNKYLNYNDQTKLKSAENKVKESLLSSKISNSLDKGLKKTGKVLSSIGIGAKTAGISPLKRKYNEYKQGKNSRESSREKKKKELLQKKNKELLQKKKNLGKQITLQNQIEGLADPSSKLNSGTRIKFEAEIKDIEEQIKKKNEMAESLYNNNAFRELENLKYKLETKKKEFSNAINDAQGELPPRLRKKEIQLEEQISNLLKQGSEKNTKFISDVVAGQNPIIRNNMNLNNLKAITERINRVKKIEDNIGRETKEYIEKKNKKIAEQKKKDEERKKAKKERERLYTLGYQKRQSELEKTHTDRGTLRQAKWDNFHKNINYVELGRDVDAIKKAEAKAKEEEEAEAEAKAEEEEGEALQKLFTNGSNAEKKNAEKVENKKLSLSNGQTISNNAETDLGGGGYDFHSRISKTNKEKKKKKAKQLKQKENKKTHKRKINYNKKTKKSYHFIDEKKRSKHHQRLRLVKHLDKKSKKIYL